MDKRDQFGNRQVSIADAYDDLKRWNEAAVKPIGNEQFYSMPSQAAPAPAPAPAINFSEQRKAIDAAMRRPAESIEWTKPYGAAPAPAPAAKSITVPQAELLGMTPAQAELSGYQVQTMPGYKELVASAPRGTPAAIPSYVDMRGGTVDKEREMARLEQRRKEIYGDGNKTPMEFAPGLEAWRAAQNAPAQQPDARQIAMDRAMYVLGHAGGTPRQKQMAYNTLQALENKGIQDAKNATDMARQQLQADTSRYGYDKRYEGTMATAQANAAKAAQAQANTDRAFAFQNIKHEQALLDDMLDKEQEPNFKDYIRKQNPDLTPQEVDAQFLAAKQRQEARVNGLYGLIYGQTPDYGDAAPQSDTPERKAMGGVVGYADGGEVDVQNPTAEGKTASMESGDYVIPVEALRFYGTKFFQSMIEKAEDDME